MSGSSRGPVSKPNPFVGPRSIETGQKIFGRDREIEQLYYFLSAERVVLLHSPSGAGKSSLIQAGLIPRLTQLFDVWGPARVNLQPLEGDAPGVSRYVRSANLGFEAQLPKKRQRARELISGMSLEEYFGSRPRRPGASPNVVLIFDQFEEIFTLGTRRPEDTQILEQLADLAENRIPEAVRQRTEASGERLSVEAGSPTYKIVLSLREDFVWRLDTLRPILPAIMRNRFALGPLDAARGLIVLLADHQRI